MTGASLPSLSFQPVIIQPLFLSIVVPGSRQINYDPLLQQMLEVVPRTEH